MFHKHAHGIRLVLVLIAIGLPTLGWSADTPMTSPSGEPRTMNDAVSSSPAASSNIVAANFISHPQMHGTTADDCENSPQSRFRQSNIKNWHPLRRKVREIRYWFSYISGHGPAIWVRN